MQQCHAAEAALCAARRRVEKLRPNGQPGLLAAVVTKEINTVEPLYYALYIIAPTRRTFVTFTIILVLTELFAILHIHKYLFT